MRDFSTFIRQVFAEDMGPDLRDVSAEALGEAGTRECTGTLLAKSEGIACGLSFVEPIIRELEDLFKAHHTDLAPTQITLALKEGSRFNPGDILGTLRGPVRTILSAERTILNLLQRLSGIATLTFEFVSIIAHTKCRILDTRKTTPGLRALEKYAVRVGGGTNHRFGLYDMIMLKDNHLAAMGGNIEQAVATARQRMGPSLKIEVETTALAQVKEALKANADIIMLDNMSLELMKEAVNIVDGKVLLEASGGITLETVRSVAETGVDFISVGALTHSAPSKDISLKIVNR